MSLPPERISIKRRRQEEPVETLVLEQNAASSKKRRFTDFFFQRLRLDRIAPISTVLQQTTTPSTSKDNHIFTEPDTSGIPLVKTSAPGDERQDFIKYKTSQKEKLEGTTQEPKVEKSKLGDSELREHAWDGHQNTSLSTSKTGSGLPSQHPGRARRFHLTHDVSSVLKPNSAGGIRRRKLNLRPPLATFVERQQVRYQHESQSIHTSPPIDRIVQLKTDALPAAGDQSITPELISTRTPLNPFLKTKAEPVRKGHSIHDDPTTWDLQSDQLANELSELALDLDPDIVESEAISDSEPDPKLTKDVSKPLSQAEAMIIDKNDDDDYVFETYVRVRQTGAPDVPTTQLGTDFGILVINEEDEDLWDKYIESGDDDDDWDDEDEDSNAEDNPRNDYPEDEVSTDDEYENNVYRYRHNASDGEEFDEERDGW